MFEPLPATGPDRQLHEGEIEVTYGDGSHEIVNQRTASVSDRAFIAGDLARLIKTTDESEVGVVVAVETEVELEGIFSRQRLPGFIPASAVVNAVRVGRGDHVIAGDWLGVVEAVMSEATISGTPRARTDRR